MNPFKDSGRYSKAWWLQLISNHGTRSVSQINLKAGRSGDSYPQTKATMQALIDSGYIEIQERTQKGWGGRNMVIKHYALTDHAKEYLAIHMDEAQLAGGK